MLSFWLVCKLESHGGEAKNRCMHDGITKCLRIVHLQRCCKHSFCCSCLHQAPWGMLMVTWASLGNSGNLEEIGRQSGPLGAFATVATCLMFRKIKLCSCRRFLPSRCKPEERILGILQHEQFSQVAAKFQNLSAKCIEDICSTHSQRIYPCQTRDAVRLLHAP